MGLLIEGIWQDRWYDTTKSDGSFVREDAQFRNWITADGAPGPTGIGGFKAEAGRYHLYVSLACPWAHRTIIFRKLKGLEDLIGMTVVHPHMLEDGWKFDQATGGDPLHGFEYLHQIYTSVSADYSGRVTVPVLWDKKTGTIVNNESSEIIRMFNSAFDGLTGNRLDFYPPALRDRIQSINDFIYPRINNGVYRAGFATTQAAYEDAFDTLFAALDKIETTLSASRYLLGNTLTEADWRLFTTLIRFDAVYHGHFKTNLKRIEDYPNISNYLRDLYQTPGIAETVDFWHIKEHYYVSQRTINPTQVVPKGPKLDYDRPHHRTSYALTA
jgi:glutathionyl-hydroquinone reductase